MFGYSDEDGTEAENLPDKVDPDEVARRVERLTALAEQLTAQRAEERVGEVVSVLVESEDGESSEGRAEHQAPDVDGTTLVRGTGLRIGDIVTAVVVDTDGVDLVADLVEVSVPAERAAVPA